MYTDFSELVADVEIELDKLALPADVDHYLLAQEIARRNATALIAQGWYWGAPSVQPLYIDRYLRSAIPLCRLPTVPRKPFLQRACLAIAAML